MVRVDFNTGVRDRRGCAVIIAGSGSDESHIDKIVDSLEEYGVPYRVRVLSAHKQSSAYPLVREELTEMDSPLVIISVAGGTDALSGLLSWGLYSPVIACPPDGVENQSPLHNPPGSSNSTIYNPKNVGRHVAQMFSHLTPDYKDALDRTNRDKLGSLTSSSDKLRARYVDRQKTLIVAEQSEGQDDS